MSNRACLGMATGYHSMLSNSTIKQRPPIAILCSVGQNVPHDERMRRSELLICHVMPEQNVIF